MRYKADWAEARERLTALWEGRVLDRPYLSVCAPRPSDVPWPGAPASAEERWLNPDWVVPHLRAQLAATYWGGEAVPSYLLMAGWAVSYGARPHFADETIWHDPLAVDWETPPAFAFDPADPWVQRYADLYRRVVAEAGWDDFLVGCPCLLPANDLLAALLGTDTLLIELLDHPEWLDAAVRQLAAAQGEAFAYFAQLARPTHAYWYGIGGWMPFWAPEPFHATQSDVSCMISTAMYDAYVLPDLETQHAQMPNLWYHLDGRTAQQHLPRLCSLPYVRVIQYTPMPDEPPNGPEHLALYRAIQAAGKIVHIQAPIANVEPLARALDPARLLIDTWADSVADAEALLAASRRWV